MNIKIKKTQQQEEINIRSEEVQEIMGRIPSWTERWGITVIALFFCILFTGAAFFPIPESLSGRFYYIPQESMDTKPAVGFVLLAAQGIGEVKAGMKVTVSLDNYPEEKFGCLSGSVYDIANTPNKDGFYQADILFFDGLKTNDSIVLPTNQQMSGTGEIIVSEKRLIDRIRKGRTF